MPRKRSEPTPRTPAGDRRRRSEEELGEPIFPVLTAAVAILFTARFFLPAESADQGETLWIVLLWLICGVAWLADAWRQGEPLRRLDWLDAGLGVLVGGHIVSAVSVLMTEGHKRAALNMLWEWIGIGVAGLLIRSVMRERAGRERLLACLLVSGVVLSGLGLWQHYVWYPRIAAQFGELEELQQQAQGDTLLNTNERQRLSDLRRELGFSFDADEASLKLLRDRVQSSTEPIGRFALANTFAGLLLVALIIGLAILPESHLDSMGLRRWVVGIIFVAVIGYCLLLTKSRTAMIGLLVAIALGLVLRGRSLWGSRWGRRTIYGVVVGAGVMVLGAFVSGSLDREVISETPKSLKYRLEYWTSTLEIIREHPLLGVGPGNFRQSYLKYKLPESSEEILDPHNLVLDVWGNGGLLALAGLACLLGVTVRRSLTILKQVLSEESLHREALSSEVFLRGAIGSLAMVLAALIELFQGTDIRGDWIWLGAGWWIVALMLTWSCPQLTNGKLAVMAGVGLFIHLSGAGGIAMPAITQIALALIFAIDELVRDSEQTPEVIGQHIISRRTQTIRLTSVVLGIAAIVTCAKTAALPVTISNMAMLEGQAALSMDGNEVVVLRALNLAVEHDPLSPQPWQEMARIRLGQWISSHEDQDFEFALEAQQAAIDRDPKSSNGWRGMGQLWWQRFKHTRNATDAQSALAGFEQATSRYPQLASLQADVALAAEASGEVKRARQAALQALELYALNRKSQHVDKFLPRNLLIELRKIADREADSDGE
ncbi:MAG: O-antigen ligase family protein [Planctomycetaceae bacterium]